jgi:negative regulator of sigma E activity
MNDEQLLILYFDGELDRAEADELEARIERDEALSVQFQELVTLRSGLRDHFSAEAERFDLEGFADRVMSALPEVELSSMTREVTSPETEDAPAGLARRIQTWFAQNTSPLLIGAAVACAILFALRAIDSPSQRSVNAPAGSTVLINLHKSEEAESDPVIWVLDEDEADEELDEKEDGQDPI